MTSTATPGGRQPADGADVLRRQCICQEDPANGPCACAQPVTRQHARWLRAYAARHPERVIILSETTGTWMSALLTHLPPGVDDTQRVLAWMRAPYDLPPAAGLRASASLGELLDMLNSPPPSGDTTPGPQTRQ